MSYREVELSKFRIERERLLTKRRLLYEMLEKIQFEIAFIDNKLNLNDQAMVQLEGQIEESNARFLEQMDERANRFQGGSNRPSNPSSNSRRTMSDAFAGIRLQDTSPAQSGRVLIRDALSRRPGQPTNNREEPMGRSNLY